MATEPAEPQYGPLMEFTDDAIEIPPGTRFRPKNVRRPTDRPAPAGWWWLITVGVALVALALGWLIGRG